jgi:hypothetical protein
MVQLVLSPKKAVWSTGAASGGVLALLVVAACGTPDAAPRPSPTVPTISTSAQVSSAPTPSNNAITVKSTTTTPPPTVEATTEPPPPPPPPAPPVETPDPTTKRPRGPFAQQGAACPVEGAVSVNRRLRPMVCTAGSGGKLRWQPI